MIIYLIGLGGNSGLSIHANAGMIARAVRRLPGKLVSVSTFYRTPAYPAGNGPDFVNGAAAVRYGGTPEALLAQLHRIEAAEGRVRLRRWAPRTLDLDLIAAGRAIRPDAATLRHWMELAPEAQAARAPGELILPHPRLADRAFVLVPLADVAPSWRHPLTGRSVLSMMAALPAARRREIRALGPVGGVVNRKVRA